MRRTKRWSITPLDDRARDLAGSLKTSPLLAQLLLNRGLTEPQECMDFLRPTPRQLVDPALIPNLMQAAQRVAQAIHDQQKIIVYGDYDVDGITASSILWHAIRQFGGAVECYVPHRIEEGYGLNAEALAQLCDAGAQLIISVDCGVTAIEQALVCKERGVDLIITDHHEWHEGIPTRHAGESSDATAPQGPVFPDCYALVHPRLPGSTYPNPHLCGAGVAFKLAWGIGRAMNHGSDRVSAEFRDFLVEATGLAALGTIADVVPLVGENRVLAQWGLSGLKKSKLHGIQALIASANLTGQKLDAYHVGFLMAPRLNACGRMGHAREAVEMLTVADPRRANEIAVYLEKQNRQRQEIERTILDQALAQVKELSLDQDACRAIVLSAEGWHPGVIGIVASRIVDRLHRPTIMIATANGHGQGSGRSIAGFHLARALEHCGHLLEGFGGHEMAAGLKIESDKVPAFREAFSQYAAGVLGDDDMIPELRLECLAELGHVTEALCRELERLGPFGHGNPTPILAIANLTVSAEPRRVGKTGDHLQIWVKQGAASMKCIAFNASHLFDRLKPGVRVDFAVEPHLNLYNGRCTVELEVKDVRFGQG